MRVLLRVAYDGTAYSGWQIQPNVVTVEKKLTEALTDLFKCSIELTGASRTDAGVHAMGNVAVFDVETQIPAEKISYALNTRLPDDIKVVESREVPAGFHPRHTDCIKTYEYTVWNNRFENPCMRLYSYFYYGNLDIDKMNEAAFFIKGEHDFTAFCSADTQVVDKVRNITDISVTKDGSIIRIRVTGNGFLYNMVRIIAGTLLYVGRGLMKPLDVKKAIESKDRQLAGPTAPAKGLTLMEIRYKELNE